VDVTGSNGTYTSNSSISSTDGIVSLTVYGYSAPSGALPAAVTNSVNPCTATPPLGSVERVVNTDLRQTGFLDYLELTDLELLDQGWYDQQNSTNIADCLNGTYNGNASWTAYAWKMKPNDCGPLYNYWVTGNELSGPVRTNDDYYLCGTPIFDSTIISDDQGGKSATYWTDPANCGADNPVFNGVQSSKGGKITHSSTLIQFPTTDTGVLSYAQAATGCYFVGPTDITLTGSTMTVVSPMTTSANSANYASCVGTGKSLPSDGVIYVDNGTGNCSSAANFGSNLNWILGTDNTTELPAGDACSSTHAPGDVFISGQLTGGLTVTSADNIFITNSLTYTNGTGSTSSDVLGLIADNYIELVHTATSSGGRNPTYTNVTNAAEPFSGSTTIPDPAGYGTSSCNNTGGTYGSGRNAVSTLDCNIVVDAAMLSLNHSLGVQAFQQGLPTGTLTVNGAIAEEYMDIEGFFATNCNYVTQGVTTLLCTGMNSVYNYDSRLKHLSPPHFLNPSYAQWRQISFAECPTTGCQTYLNS